MKFPLRFSVACAVVAFSSALSGFAVSTSTRTPSAVFEWFEYTGCDATFAAPIQSGQYRNPILAGFYPDPSICRAGNDYYLVNSSFAYFPGVPIFHSHDLVHWRQIGHVLDRSTQLKLEGLGVSRGIFAPTLRYRSGVFYLITTLVGGGGNFYVTATDPSGPWSDPVWLDFEGIDPSFFFDDDGRAYIVNNGMPLDGHELYPGHRAIWIQEFDLGIGRLSGPREIIVNGGTDLAKKPVWIEGPHLYKTRGYYYLVSAEGGTGEDHSEVVFRSRSVRGPYLPWDKNPILTQRNLPAARVDPVTCTGHADLVETPEGWWAVFLGCRPYEGKFYNTGRETFLLPVNWSDDDWPRILPLGESVPRVVTAPNFAGDNSTGTVLSEATADLESSAAPQLTGNFTWRDEFTEAKLLLAWNTLRGPNDVWLSLTENHGALTLHPRADSLGSNGHPVFLGRRQQHPQFTATTALGVPDAGVSAGLAVLQNESHHYFLGVHREGTTVSIFLERANGISLETIARNVLSGPMAARVELKIEMNGRVCTFSYAAAPNRWVTLLADADASLLSTAKAGGFVGVYVGPHARLEH